MIAEKRVSVSRLKAFRAENFPDSGPDPWLDRPDAFDQIDRKVNEGSISSVEAEQCRYWVKNGYIIVRHLVEDATLNEVWSAYERAIRAGKIKLVPEPAGANDPFPGRFLNPHKKAGSFCRVLKHPGLLRWIGVLLGHEAKPLQTIASHKGSQQPAHSDSIHMTTYPIGYLAAAWIAFEDIHADSGPLEYYPGSHRLPYYFSRDVGISEQDFKGNSYATYQAKYEPHVQRLIEKHGLKPKYFLAKNGDVLIWHANLLHGGSLRKDLTHSRRAVVCHYYAKGAFVYHDLAAARSRQQYMGTCLLRDHEGKSFFGRSQSADSINGIVTCVVNQAGDVG